MALATLSIDLEARLAKFEQGMDRAGRLLEKLSAGATTAGGRISEIFAGNLAADAASQIFQRLVTFFPQVADGVLAIKDLAEATGSSVESISALDDIARRSGDSLQAVEGVLIKFNAALKEADGKNGVSQALQALGLNAKELRELDPAEALQRTAQALNGFADDGNRARLTQELFGKGVKEAATFLRDLAEAGQLNATVTSAQAEEIDKLTKNIAGLRTNMEQAGRSIAGVVVPAINELFDVVRGNGPGALETYLAVPLQAASVLGANVAFVMKGIGTEIGGIAAQAAAVARLDFAGARLIGEEMRRDAARSRAEFDALERRLLQIGSAPQADFSNEGRNRTGRPPPRLPALADASKLKEAKSSFEDYQQTLTKGLADLINKTDTVKLAELNAQFDKLTELAKAGLDPKIVEQVQRLLVPPAGANAGPPIPETLARVNELLQQTDSAKLAAAARDAALLREELAKTASGSARFTQLQNALLDVETTITDLSGTFPAFFEQVDQQAQQTANVIEGTLGSSFRSILEGNFSDIGKMWGNLLIDMVAQAAAADLANKLFGERNAQGNRAGGGWFDLAVKFLTSAKGNAFGPGGVYAFANGGVVSGATPFTFGGGKMGVMGEAGDEAVMPLKRDSRGRLGVMSSGGGRQTVVNNYTNLTVSGDPNPATLATMQAMLAKSNQQLVRGLKTGSIGAN